MIYKVLKSKKEKALSIIVLMLQSNSLKHFSKDPTEPGPSGSFCTNKYKQGMRITDIMHFSGHKTEREFQKYIRIQGEERTNYIVGQGYFNIK